MEAARFPSVPEIDFNLICEKLTKNQIGPPAFPNGGRGQPIFCRFNFATPIILQHLEKVVSKPDADLKLNEGYKLFGD